MAKRGTNQFTGKTQLDWLIAAIARHQSDECLLWPFKNLVMGYGRLHYEGKPVFAHRLAYKLVNGDWPKPKGLHSCNVSLCINPRHIRAGTQQENVEQRVKEGRNGSRRDIRGRANPNARWTDNQILAIRRLSHLGVSMGQLAFGFNTAMPVISNIIHGKRWAHLPIYPEELQILQGVNQRAGEKNGNAKLTELSVKEIRKLAATGVTQRSLAKQYGVHRTVIRRAIERHTWPHVI